MFMLNVLSFEVDNSMVDALFELIDSEIFAPTCRHDVETGLSRVEVFFEDAAQEDAIRGVLTDAAALLALVPRFERSALEPSDWAESWKRFFHVERVSPRIVVRPVWEEYSAAPGECVIAVDPGMSFGTGKHATTRACLRLLDALADELPGASFLDMGCGSGILAIGAAKLGFTDVRGFDIDPECVRIAGENAAVNGCTIPFYEAGVDRPHPQAAVAAANILAPVLIEFAGAIAASVAPGGRLVLSGILDAQYAAVRERFEREGFTQVRSVLVEEWRSGDFTAAVPPGGRS
jgi:ribosomal protein L11 methyltransferase